jgi:hypothetical protein
LRFVSRIGAETNETIKLGRRIFVDRAQKPCVGIGANVKLDDARFTIDPNSLPAGNPDTGEPELS